MASDNQKIIDAIDQAINSKSEKTFLDFKVKWHEKNDAGKSSLIHDILCLCNCDYDDDRYLIIGIADNFSVKGIENDSNRRNVENLTDLTKNFNKHPKIEVREVNYQENRLDVVIIGYHRNHIRPFYVESLSDSQKRVIKNNCYKGLSAGSIYSRNNNTNTPKDSTTNKFEIEKMWREHFGIDKSALERFKIYLEKPEDWEECVGGEGYYYKYFPEFKVIDSDPEGNEEKRSSYLKIDNPPASGENRYINAPIDKVVLQFHSTKIYEGTSVEVYYQLSNNFITEIMHPDHRFFDESGLFEGSDPRGKYLFFFVFEESFLYRISKFLIEKQYERISDGVFCYDISEFNPNGRFIFVLKGDDKKDYRNIKTSIEELSRNEEKMRLIKNDPRFVS